MEKDNNPDVMGSSIAVLQKKRDLQKVVNCLLKSSGYFNTAFQGLIEDFIKLKSLGMLCCFHQEQS